MGLPAITEGLSYGILRNAQIAARFGVDRPPAAEWPYVADANGSKLVEQISETPIRGIPHVISRGTFNDKQQLALRGAEALATVIDYDGNADRNVIDLLIRKCYTWYAAQGRVLRLPVAVAPPMAVPSGAATTPALSPTIAGTSTDGNRSLFGATARELLP